MIWELVPSIWVLKASGIGVWELGSSSFRFFFFVNWDLCIIWLARSSRIWDIANGEHETSELVTCSCCLCFI